MNLDQFDSFFKCFYEKNRRKVSGKLKNLGRAEERLDRFGRFFLNVCNLVRITCLRKEKLIMLPQNLKIPNEIVFFYRFCV